MNAIRRLLAATLAGALVACSGGGGAGSTPSPPVAQPPPPAAITRAEAFRFLNQATFGPTEADITQVIALGYEGWIDAQLRQPASLELPRVQQALAALPAGTPVNVLHVDRVDSWFRNALTAPDQLRQRVAFALSEIMVVSQASALEGFPLAVTSYYDTLAQDAFGNYRQLMEDVTLHPAMGIYLSMLGNQKPDTARNIRPDENYARELMQLFTIGLVELNVDGSERLDAQSKPVPTYDQLTIEGFAHVYTGWTWAGAASFALARPTPANQIQAMQVYPEQHDVGAKRVLSYSGAAFTQIPAGQAPAQDLHDALDNIFRHPNVGPFVARQLIQRLVASNPSPQYVERVARRFNDDGSGARGNLAAVVKAILLDPEARAAPASDTAGKLKEPLLRLTQLWRAYGAHSDSGRYIGQNPTAILGQGPLQAPSVFNFFSPRYAPPGEIADRTLVAPEMQLATEYLNTWATNYFLVQTFCYTTVPIDGCPAVPDNARADLVKIDVQAEQSSAADSAALVQRVSDKLLGDAPSPALRAEVLAAVDRVPANVPALRVAQTLYLLSTSPEFVAQR